VVPHPGKRGKRIPKTKLFFEKKQPDRGKRVEKRIRNCKKRGKRERTESTAFSDAARKLRQHNHKRGKRKKVKMYEVGY